MHDIFYFFTLIFLSEFALKLNIFQLISLNITIVKKIFPTLLDKKISDDYKEEFIIKNSLKLFKLNAILFIKFVLIFSPLILFFISFPQKTYILYSPLYLISSVLVIITYFKIKNLWLSRK